MATEAAKSYRTDRDFLTAELQRVQNDRDDLKLQASALESKLNAVTDERDAALKRIDDFGSMGTVAKHTLIEDSGVAALRTQCDELQARVDSAVARLLRRDELAMLVPMGFTYDLLAILQQGEES
jgi:chromosome segregation ATPase